MHTRHRKPATPIAALTITLTLVLALAAATTAGAQRTLRENTISFSIPIQISIVPGIALPGHPGAFIPAAGDYRGHPDSIPGRYTGPGDAILSIGLIGAINNRIDLLQISNVFNIASTVSGLQAAGVFNIAGRSLDGIQLAGVFNISGSTRTPLQAAGVFNIAGDLTGAQAAGVLNIAKDLKGIQTSGVVNIARNVRGLQIGVVNIADTVEGLQIGLLNFSSNGISELGTSHTSADNYTHLWHKTGRNGLYLVYGASAPTRLWNPVTDPSTITVNAGLGARIGSSRSLHLDADLRAEQLLGPDHDRFLNALHHRNGLTPADVLRPWPTANLALGLPLGPVTLVGGAKVDLNLASAPWLPEPLRRGSTHTGRILGTDYTAYTKLYLGISL